MDLKRNGWYSQTGLRIPPIISKLKNNTKHVLNACGIMLCIILCFLWREPLYKYVEIKDICLLHIWFTHRTMHG